MDLARGWPETLREIGGRFVPLTLTPHSRLTVSPENLREVAALAVEQGAIITVHASEIFLRIKIRSEPTVSA